MIIIQVAGGLGNQLQQYALYRKLVRLGKEVRLDISWFDQVQMKETGHTSGMENVPVVTKGFWSCGILTVLFLKSAQKKKKQH